MAESGTNLISSINKSGSGVDLANLVEGLVKAETDVNQKSITKKVDDTNLQISSLGLLNTKLSTFSSALTKLESTSGRSVSSANTAVSLTVTDEATAQDINANISVSSIAKGQVVTYDLTHANLLNSNTLSTASTIPQGNLTLTLAGVNTVITIDSTNNTVQGLVDKINEISGMQASTVDTSGSGGLALVLKSNTGTANAFSLSSSDGLSAYSTSGINASSSPVALSVTATNAVFDLDGLTISRSVNSITDVFEGYTLDIKSTNSDAFNIASSISSDDAKTKMQDFVTSLNDIKTFLLTETKRGLNGAEDGSLVRDTAATQILRDISAFTTREIVGYSDTSFYLANLGVQTEQDGSISFDTDKFNTAITADPTLMNIVFSSKYSSTSDVLKVSGSQNFPPVPGSYSFEYTSGGDATLNGQTISSVLNGSNNKVFTGTSGDAQNLSVEMLSDTNTTATVRYGKSLIDSLQQYVTDITSTSGLLSSRTSTLNENLSDYDEEQTALDEKIEALTTSYNKRFGDMEALVTQLNKTGEYLTSLMDAWNKKD